MKEMLPTALAQLRLLISSLVDLLLALLVTVDDLVREVFGRNLPQCID